MPGRKDPMAVYISYLFSQNLGEGNPASNDMGLVSTRSRPGVRGGEGVTMHSEVSAVHLGLANRA